MKTLRIKPESKIELPYRIQIGSVEALGAAAFVVFSTDGELPDKEADAQLQTSPHIFELAPKTEADPKKYIWKRDFVNRVMGNEITRLSGDDQVKVFKLIDELNAKAEEKSKKEKEAENKAQLERNKKKEAENLADRKRAEASGKVST